MKTCFFTGHRDVPYTIQRYLDEAVDRVIREYGVECFIVGYKGAFDQLAISSIQKSILKYPERGILAYVMLSGLEFGKGILVPHYFDGRYTPYDYDTGYDVASMERTSMLTLEQADYLIAYVHRRSDVAYRVYRQAKRNENDGYLKIFNLAE